MPENKINDYDLEPITYCAKCYSLKIKYEEAIDSDCCMECGCSDTITSNIYEWEKLYEKRYGKKYTEKGKDIKKHPIFNLSLDKLKRKVYENPSWSKIVYRMYPYFPRGYSKADSIILFFDKLIKDNRLDDLRILLINQQK